MAVPHNGNTCLTWLMWSAPVQVKLQVSLAHRTCSGELSRLEPLGYSIVINRLLSVSLGSPRLASLRAAFSKVKAAGYARPHTACMKGVQPSAFLLKAQVVSQLSGHRFVQLRAFLMSNIPRVSDQNGVSLLYIMLEMHHSGREASIHSTRGSVFHIQTCEQTSFQYLLASTVNTPTHPTSSGINKAHTPPNPPIPGNKSLIQNYPLFPRTDKPPPPPPPCPAPPMPVSQAHTPTIQDPQIHPPLFTEMDWPTSPPTWQWARPRGAAGKDDSPPAGSRSEAPPPAVPCRPSWQAPPPSGWCRLRPLHC